MKLMLDQSAKPFKSRSVKLIKNATMIGMILKTVNMITAGAINTYGCLLFLLNLNPLPMISHLTKTTLRKGKLAKNGAQAKG